jgi:hypothetical protein
MKTINLSLIFLFFLIPSVSADIMAAPIGAYFIMGFVIVLAIVALNYGINFVISLPLAKALAKTKTKDIAKGLLIITPIMFALESLFITLMDIWKIRQIIAIGMFSFILIFLCYFIIGEKIWDMNGKKAAFIAVIMSITTNPAYFAPFFN